MKTVRVYRLDHLSPSQLNKLKAAQQEAAQVWNLCMETHKAARLAQRRWSAHTDLHSQSVQAIFRAFLANIDTTRRLRSFT